MRVFRSLVVLCVALSMPVLLSGCNDTATNATPDTGAADHDHDHEHANGDHDHGDDHDHAEGHDDDTHNDASAE